MPRCLLKEFESSKNGGWIEVEEEFLEEKVNEEEDEDANENDHDVRLKDVTDVNMSCLDDGEYVMV